MSSLMASFAPWAEELPVPATSSRPESPTEEREGGLYPQEETVCALILALPKHYP